MRAVTVCKHGHDFTPENTYTWQRTGKRICKACAAERMRRCRDKQRLVKAAAREAEVVAARPTVSDVDLSWAAGVFEGEGTVTITGGGRHGYTRSFVVLTNTDFEMPGFFHATWGGSLKDVQPKSPNAKLARRWSINSSRAVASFIEQILPFIKTKRVRDKMRLALDAHKARHQGTRDPNYKAQCHEYRERMRALNQRGRKMPPMLPDLRKA